MHPLYEFACLFSSRPRKGSAGDRTRRTAKAAWSEAGGTRSLALVADDGTLLLRRVSRGRREPAFRQLGWPSPDLPTVSALCFDPSGERLLCAASDATLYVLPIPSSTSTDGAAKVDAAWNSDDVVKIEMSGKRARPTSVVWWVTADRQQIAVVGNELGEISFVNLMTKKEVGGTYVTVAIAALRLIPDEAQDSLYLLVTGSNDHQWQLLLEQKSSRYQWPLEQELDMSTTAKNAKETSAEGQSDHQPQRLTRFAGHVRAMPQCLRGQHFVAGYCSASSTLSMYTSDLNSVPSIVYKMPADCDQVIVTDRLMFVMSNGKRRLTLVSNHVAESAAEANRDYNPDAEIQSFSLPVDEKLILMVKQSSVEPLWPSTAIPKVTSQSAPSSPRYGTRERWSSGSPGHGASFRRSNFQYGSKAEVDLEQRVIRSATALDSCLLVFETAIYECRPRTSPEHLFLHLVLSQQDPRASERLSFSLGLDLNRLYEVAADSKLSQGQFAAAVRLYQLSKCPHVRSIANFAAHGCVAELLSYVRVLSFSQGQMEFSLTDKRHFANMELLCYVHQILELKSGTTALVQAFENFLHINQHYSEDFAVQLLAEQGMFDVLLRIATHKGLLFVMAEEILQGQLPSWLDKSTFNCFRERGYGKLLRTIDNEKFMQCLTEPRLFVYLLTQPALAQKHSHFLLPILTTIPLPLLNRAAALYDPSNAAARPFLHKALASDSSSLPNGHAEIWNLVPKEHEAMHIRYLVETFVAILLVMNTNRGFSPFELDFLLSQSEEASDGSMTDSFCQRARLPRRYSPVACGLAHAALVRNGDVYTWGRNDKCCLGQGLPRLECMPPTQLDMFARLHMRVIAVSCGAYHCLALTNHGVYGWGSSSYGQVGTGHVSKEPCPVPLESFANEKIVSVACGQYHSLALTDDGRVFTWGWGVHGQLGHGNPEDCSFPRRVEALSEEVVVRISAGYGHSAVLTAKGDIYTFGCGLFGQLGLGSVNKHSIPQYVQLPEKINLLACGYFHNIAVSASNKIYTWGSNPQLLRSQAQASRKARLQAHLGRGNSTDKTPAEEEATDSTDASAAGAVDVAHKERPESRKGLQLHLSPSLLESTVAAPITQIACGSHHSALLTVDGEVFTWGRNLDGQLGNGTRKEQKTPTAVIGLGENKITRVSCGHDFTLAIDATGKVWGWGHNDYGQIGLDMDLPSACNKMIVIKANKRVVQLRNTTQWGIVRPQEITGLAPPRSTFEYEPTPSFDSDDVVKLQNEESGLFKGQKLLRLLLPPLVDFETPSYGCRTIHRVVEVLNGLYDPNQIVHWAVQCKNFQLAAKVCRLHDDVTQSFAYELQALHQLSVGASNVNLVIRAVERHLELIDATDTESTKTLLQHTIDFWMSERLPPAALEELLLGRLGRVARPLSSLLFCFENFDTSVSREAASYVLGRLSSRFCLDLVWATLEQMESDGVFPEYLALLSSATKGKTDLPAAEWKAILGKDHDDVDEIALSPNELESLLCAQERDAADVPHRDGSLSPADQLVLFSCGHHFTSRDFYGTVLPKFEEAMRTQLPRSLSRTTQALSASYREDRLLPSGCPDCVHAAVRRQL